MRITVFLLLFVLSAMVGCASDKKSPQLFGRAELKVNQGETVRIVGLAHYSKVTGPSIAGDDFELRIYPRNLWGPELDGKKVEVTGKVNDSTRTTPPDPSVLPYEYWLSNASWVPVDTRKKK